MKKIIAVAILFLLLPFKIFWWPQEMSYRYRNYGFAPEYSYTQKVKTLGTGIYANLEASLWELNISVHDCPDFYQLYKLSIAPKLLGFVPYHGVVYVIWSPYGYDIELWGNSIYQGYAIQCYY